MEYKKSVLKAVKEHCKNTCCCGDMESWKNCTIKECMLWPFRMGKNPFRKKREMTGAQRTAAAERLRKAREAKQD